MTMRCKNQGKSYWIYGKHSAIAILQNPRRQIHQIVTTKQDILSPHLENSPIVPLPKVEVISSKEFSKMLAKEDNVAQGIAMKVSPLVQPSLDEFITNESHTVILTDKVTDLTNIGAIIRIAAAFQVGAVITTNDGAPAESAGMIKSACGTFETTPYIQVVNLTRAIKILQSIGYFIVGLSAVADKQISRVSDIWNLSKVGIVLGSEGSGIRRLVSESCDMLLSIEMSSNSDSLNVSSAAAIAAYLRYTGLRS